MSNLITLQKNYILSVIDSVQTAHNLKFLVIDSFVLNIFESIFPTNNTNELLKHVTSCDLIDDIKRTGEHPIEVIYLLKPTKYNIKIMNSDFEQFPTKYKKCHLRFLPGLNMELKNFLDSQIRLPYFISSMEEVKLSLLPKQSFVFQSLDMPDSFQVFYNKNCLAFVEEYIETVVNSLINVCIITGEYPIIRNYQPSEKEVKNCQSVCISQLVAKLLQERLDDYARTNYNYPNPKNNRQRSIMLITDRTLDFMAPLVHDFTYQSIAYNELTSKKLNKDKDTYDYEVENEQGIMETKTGCFKEMYDNIWQELRYLHIIDAKDNINQKIKKLIEDNSLLVDRQNVKNASDLLSVVAHLKMFDEERRQLILHKVLIEECMKNIGERKLAENVAEPEQVMLSKGRDSDGNNVSKGFTLNYLLDEVLSVEQVSIMDKVRCIAMYGLYRGGLIEEDYVKLLNFINVDFNHPFFEQFMRFYSNFEMLGCPIMKKSVKQKPFIEEGGKKLYHETILNNTEIYTTSRFVPACGVNISKSITNALLLPESEFNFIKGIPVELYELGEDRDLINNENEEHSVSSIIKSNNIRSQRIKTNWNIKKENGVNIERQRIFYYIIGGVTHAELKAAYDQSVWKNRDVFIGSDAIITPANFMENVLKLSASREELELVRDQKINDEIPVFFRNVTKQNHQVNQRRPFEDRQYNNEMATPSQYMRHEGKQANQNNGSNNTVSTHKSHDYSNFKEDDGVDDNSRNINGSTAENVEKKQKKPSKFRKLFK
ncbi:Sec1-like protein [Hanseniaspora valbyensis NRRL Y-1626]|uniref:Sec1-like protein n=1 Tax=Hanseniaspora valbyensis NRRL Y-1626 TaxID=766949 RepID=A0A1B7TIH3_9ASCO|nr:Sec1-like protein [Hanseniaspora valbyensis NRRL Y-1626]